MANKDYYKGNRQGALPGGVVTGPPGRHTRRGKYVLDDTKVRVYISPPPSVLEATKLRPFVSRAAELPVSQERKDLGHWRALKGRNYLRMLTKEQKEQARDVARSLPPIPEPSP
ncbi:hypothetical protein CPB86DRAFT_695646 [Serendipita vermifera]|nr:hypothetical protein CPB86DRAFT_695646 [Serendipita vermifera]